MTTQVRRQGQTRETAAQTPLPLPPPRPLGAAPAPGQVRLVAGADVQDLALAGRTVAEARAIAQAVFGVRADARALVDGHAVPEDTVLVAGQRLEFTREAGQKGASDPVIQVEGDRATWRPGGKPMLDVPLRDLLQRVADAGQPPERWRLTPPHVRLMVERRGGRVVGVAVEMPPGPRRVSWIAGNSRVPFGARARFVERELGFPWVVLLLVFVDGELSGVQQAFFRTAPLGGVGDALALTNLLNVARGYGLESWVCLANLTARLGRLSWTDRIRVVTDHFWQAAYTRSSEIHEGNSAFEGSAAIDPRLATVEGWEEATRRNPYFALEVAWPPAPEPLGRTMARMLDGVAPWRATERSEQLVTLLQQPDA